MATKSVLSIDIGTSSLKAAIVDLSGRLSGYARERLDSFYGTMDPAEAWVRALKRALSSLPEVKAVEAITISGNGPTLVLTDSELRPLAPTISWIDTAPLPVPATRSLYLPRLAGAMARRGPIDPAVKRILGCPEYLTALLTSEYVTFTPQEEFNPYIWDEEQMESYGVDPGLFAPFCEAGRSIGQVTASGASLFGVPAGIGVYAGLTDFHAALIGSDCLAPGTTCDRAGTSEGINHILSEKREVEGLRTLPAILPGTYTIAGLMPSSGEIFEWYRRASLRDSVSYEELTREITMSICNRSYYFFPYRSPSVTSEGGQVGGIFSDGGSCSDDAIGRGRAVAEAIAFSLRELVDRLREAGCRIETLRHCGGQARSYHWNHMKAQATRCTIEVPAVADAELLGTAALSFTALGEFSTLQEASSHLVHVSRIYEPLSSTAVLFDTQYRAWRDSRDQSGFSSKIARN